MSPFISNETVMPKEAISKYGNWFYNAAFVIWLDSFIKDKISLNKEDTLEINNKLSQCFVKLTPNINNEMDGTKLSFKKIMTGNEKPVYSGADRKIYDASQLKCGNIPISC